MEDSPMGSEKINERQSPAKDRLYVEDEDETMREVGEVQEFDFSEEEVEAADRRRDPLRQH
jgi:hypothetical protein